MLKNFRLVKTDGLKGVFHKGRLIPFDKIDDTVAEQLYGKTHVLECVEGGQHVPALPVAETSTEEAPETQITGAAKRKS